MSEPVSRPDSAITPNTPSAVRTVPIPTDEGTGPVSPPTRTAEEPSAVTPTPPTTTPSSAPPTTPSTTPSEPPPETSAPGENTSSASPQQPNETSSAPQQTSPQQPNETSASPSPTSEGNNQQTSQQQQQTSNTNTGGNNQPTSTGNTQSSPGTSQSSAALSTYQTVEPSQVGGSVVMITIQKTSTFQVSGTAAPAAKGKSNTGAIVGGVVGGVGGALLLATILGCLFWRRKKSKAVAFDDKMFDPDLSTRHSAADNLDFIAPTDPTLSDVDPYPYQPSSNGTYEQHSAYDHQPYDPNAYDQYNQSSMAMPDARDYQPYPNYGYGAAAAGAGAGAAAAYGHHDYADDPYATPAAAAKAREAGVERAGALSPAGHSASSAAGSAVFEDAISNQGHMSNQGHEAAYTDAHGDGMQEIPPNYNSIPRPDQQ